METIFTNTRNSNTNEPYKFRLPLADKLNFNNPNKKMTLANLSIYYTQKTINLHITTINLKCLLKLGMTNLILPDGLCSISDIQISFKYIIKKHETITKNLL